MAKRKLEEIAQWCKTRPILRVTGAAEKSEKRYNVVVLEDPDAMHPYSDRVYHRLTYHGYEGSKLYSVGNMPLALNMLETGEVSLLLFNWRSNWTGELQQDWLDNLTEVLTNEGKSMPPVIVTWPENREKEQLEEKIMKYLPKR